MSLIRHEPRAPTHSVALSTGDTIDRHRHDEHQLIYVSAGVLAIRTALGAWVAAHDRALWVPSGVWHEHRFYGDCSFHTVGFPVAGAPVPGTSPTVLAVDGLLRELLIVCTGSGLDPGEADRVHAVLRDRLHRATSTALRLPTARDPRLVDACALVEGDLSLPRTLRALAGAVSTSERTVDRLFRREFAMTYTQWRTNARAFHAMIRLAGGATVTETAHHCGFATTSAFVDTFARTMGQTPGSYRKAAVRAVR